MELYERFIFAQVQAQKQLFLLNDVDGQTLMAARSSFFILLRSSLVIDCITEHEWDDHFSAY